MPPSSKVLNSNSLKFRNIIFIFDLIHKSQICIGGITRSKFSRVCSTCISEINQGYIISYPGTNSLGFPNKKSLNIIPFNFNTEKSISKIGRGESYRKTLGI
uniref:Uncharacterized protein n=1 Tax=Lepeophtheirus salmonis TaxID=72036 RepID=A0A0K2UNT3_LEPSM